MIKVYSENNYSLYVGDESYLPIKNMYIISAAKEPYHRRALGYTTRAAPKDHPEYLWAYRKNNLILNLVDARDFKYIPKKIIDEVIKCINQQIKQTNIFLHCNEGISRSPSIALLYLATKGKVNSNIDKAMQEFTQIYPIYCPSQGILDFIYIYWQEYHNNFRQGVKLLES